MIQQALAAGVHGILLCTPKARKRALMIEARAHPFAPRVEGWRRARGQRLAGLRLAQWGVTSPNTCASPSPGR
jgi:hypothetical protein